MLYCTKNNKTLIHHSDDIKNYRRKYPSRMWLLSVQRYGQELSWNCSRTNLVYIRLPQYTCHKFSGPTLKKKNKPWKFCILFNYFIQSCKHCSYRVIWRALVMLRISWWQLLHKISHGIFTLKRVPHFKIWCIHNSQRWKLTYLKNVRQKSNLLFF